MKSARAWAEQLWSELPMGVGGLLDREAWIDGVEVLFKAHARDQRHLCADAINAADYDNGAPVDTAYGAVMNAPFPGKARRSKGRVII